MSTNFLHKNLLKRSYAEVNMQGNMGAWLGFWAAIATLVLGILIIVAGLLGCTGNLVFSISKLWAYTTLAVSFVRKEIKY